MATLINKVVGVAGVCSYTCKLKKFVKNWVLHKKSFLCNTQSLTDFSRAPRRDIFSKIGMGNVRGITKNDPNLQVYEHNPVTPTTLSIKVVIVVFYLYGV